MPLICTCNINIYVVRMGANVNAQVSCHMSCPEHYCCVNKVTKVYLNILSLSTSMQSIKNAQVAGCLVWAAGSFWPDCSVLILEDTAPKSLLSSSHRSVWYKVILLCIARVVVAECASLRKAQGSSTVCNDGASCAKIFFANLVKIFSFSLQSL